MSDGRVVRARAVRETSSNVEVKKEDIDHITQYPWMSAGVIIEGSRRSVVREEGVPDDRPKGYVDTRKSILERVGYTPGCQKCRATEMNNEYKLKTSHHSEKCRTRVEEKMMEFPDLKRK